MSRQGQYDPETVAYVLALSDERDMWQRVGLEREQAAFQHGQAAGIETGRAAGAAELDAAWNKVAAPIAHPSPSFAELETRRWGPGGRERFGEPREGDYEGGRAGEREADDLEAAS
jgi:hypothetical protein